MRSPAQRTLFSSRKIEKCSQAKANAKAKAMLRRTALTQETLHGFAVAGLNFRFGESLELLFFQKRRREGEKLPVFKFLDFKPSASLIVDIHHRFGSLRSPRCSKKRFLINMTEKEKGGRFWALLVPLFVLIIIGNSTVCPTHDEEEEEEILIRPDHETKGNKSNIIQKIIK